MVTSCIFAVDCTIQQFAKLIGRSVTFTKTLSYMGIVDWRLSGVSLFWSLRDYLCSYLPPWDRKIEIAAIVERLKLPPLPRVQLENIKNCFILNCYIKKAAFILATLKILTKLTGENFKAQIAATSTYIETLRDWLIIEQWRLKKKFQTLPSNILLVLLARYADCLSWWQVADNTSYSLSHVKRLHRQGLFLLAQE